MCAFAAQFVEVAGLALHDDVQLCPQHGQHGQQLAGAEFGRPAALKARQRFGRHACLGRDVALLEAEQLAAHGDGFTEFLEGLQLIFASIIYRYSTFFDAYINKLNQNRA